MRRRTVIPLKASEQTAENQSQQKADSIGPPDQNFEWGVVSEFVFVRRLFPLELVCTISDMARMISSPFRTAGNVTIDDVQLRAAAKLACKFWKVGWK